MNFFNRTLTTGGIVAVAFILTPALVLACPTGKSWSSVSVNQQQSADSSHQVSFSQSADVTATNAVGDVYVTSHSSGEQYLTAHQGSQEQSLTAASGLTWDDTAQPAAFTATTRGSVEQSQNGWSSLPMNAEQKATIWQGTRQGNTWLSTADSTVQQASSGTVGDLHQDQSISGRTQAKGHVYVPMPSCHWCSHVSSWSGSLYSRVNVLVENFFTI